jgi:hypothetical protein
MALRCTVDSRRSLSRLTWSARELARASSEALPANSVSGVKPSFSLTGMDFFPTFSDCELFWLSLLISIEQTLLVAILFGYFSLFVDERVLGYFDSNTVNYPSVRVGELG